MTRRRMFTALAFAALAALFYWIATNTYWDDVEIPMPLRGEARTNPTYAAQKLVEKLGGRATRDLVLAVPPSTSVIVLSRWTWDLSAGRRDAIERWVESGGRLVLDTTVHTDDEFERWSGIGYRFLSSDENSEGQACRTFTDDESRERRLCRFDDDFSLTTSGQTEWTLRDPKVGIQVMRVPMGRGSVTVVNADPFTYSRLFDGDHGWLLVRAAKLRRGDDVHFLSEGDYPSLLALTWQRGEPVVILGLALIGFFLWRGAVRFGPLAPATSTARRSLAEQIRGTGQFALHHGGNESLHAACVRALEEVARRRVAGYAHLPKRARAGAVAALAGIGQKSLAAALYNPPPRRSHELRSAIVLIETARRRLLRNVRLEPDATGISHGN
jgi:hypothetical protein